MKDAAVLSDQNVLRTARSSTSAKQHRIVYHSHGMGPMKEQEYASQSCLSALIVAGSFSYPSTLNPKP